MLFFRGVFVLVIVGAYTLVWVCVIWQLCGSPCDPALALLCSVFAGYEREGRGKECWCYSGPPAGVVVVQTWAACAIYWKLQSKVNSEAASYWFSSDDLDEDGVAYQTGSWSLEHNNTGLVCLREQGINILCFVTIALCLLRGQHWSEQNLTPLKCIISWQINISIHCLCFVLLPRPWV